VLRDINNKVTLVGHADAIPIHNQHFKNNWELSSARSLNLLALLATEYGIDESRLSIHSYGSYSPKNSNDTENGRAENRRVEILIVNESAQEPNPH
jgi:chemotaxis protein MotB